MRPCALVDYGAHLLASRAEVRGPQSRGHTLLNRLLSPYLRSQALGTVRKVEHALEVATAISEEDDAPAAHRVADLMVSDLSARRNEYIDLSFPCPQGTRYQHESARRRRAVAPAMRQLKESH